MYRNCFICQFPLIKESPKPTICPKLECKIKLENLIVGDYTVKKIKTNHEFCSFMLNLTYLTVLSERRGHVFSPFPASFLNDDQTRNFDKVLECCKDLLKQWDEIVQTCLTNTTDQQLSDKVGNDNYRLLKFIVMSSTFSLSIIRKENEFVIYDVLNPLKKEDEFRNIKKDGGKYFLYHGSSAENWFSILRNGLKNCSNSKLMIHGTGKGNGIYLSDKLSFSLGYAGSQFPKIIAIVEISDHPKNYDKGGCEFVVDDHKKIIIRYLAVLQKSDFDIKTITNICNTLLNGR